MQHSDISLAAARRLAGSWNNGNHIDALPAECRPAGRAEGYAIQARLEARSGSALYGWKIAATSSAGQAHINVTEPIAGRLLAERVIANAGVVPPGPNHMRVADAGEILKAGIGDFNRRVQRRHRVQNLGDRVGGGARRKVARHPECTFRLGHAHATGSYTHLTLPTRLLV